MLLFFIILASCAHSPYFENEHSSLAGERYIRQCSLPTLIASSEKLTALKADRVTSAVKHWNESVGERLLLDLGVVTDIPIEANEAFTFVTIVDDIEERGKNLCGVTKFQWDAHGCVKTSIIYVSEKCSGNDDVFETIVRHELGHLLGLSHVNDFTKLMNPHIESTVQHPVDVSKEEIENIRNLYVR